jgi:hypothetical protein
MSHGLPAFESPTGVPASSSFHDPEPVTRRDSIGGFDGIIMVHHGENALNRFLGVRAALWPLDMIRQDQFYLLHHLHQRVDVPHGNQLAFLDRGGARAGLSSFLVSFAFEVPFPLIGSSISRWPVAAFAFFFGVFAP